MHRIGHADRALALEQHLVGERIGLDPEVGRERAGSRKARAADQRLPPLIVTWK
jgi:hypothetical protein